MLACVAHIVSTSTMPVVDENDSLVGWCDTAPRACDVGASHSAPGQSAHVVHKQSVAVELEGIGCL